MISIFSTLFSRRIEQLDQDQLPNDKTFIINFQSLKGLEPIVENWTPEWYHDIDKDEVINEIKKIYSDTKKYYEEKGLDFGLAIQRAQRQADRDSQPDNTASQPDEERSLDFDAPDLQPGDSKDLDVIIQKYLDTRRPLRPTRRLLRSRKVSSYRSLRLSCW